MQGERIAALAEPGTLPTDAARVIDATGLIVVPGGVEPHTHLTHAIMSHPESPSITLGPEEDTRGMACGGTTTQIDFCYVRPSSDIMPVVEQRAARWKGQSHVDCAFHITLAGALPLADLAQAMGKHVADMMLDLAVEERLQTRHPRRRERHPSRYEEERPGPSFCGANLPGSPGFGPVWPPSPRCRRASKTVEIHEGGGHCAMARESFVRWT